MTQEENETVVVPVVEVKKGAFFGAFFCAVVSRVQRKQRLLAKGWFTGEAKEVFIF